MKKTRLSLVGLAVLAMTTTDGMGFARKIPDPDGNGMKKTLLTVDDGASDTGGGDAQAQAQVGDATQIGTEAQADPGSAPQAEAQAESTTQAGAEGTADPKGDETQAT